MPEPEDQQPQPPTVDLAPATGRASTSLDLTVRRGLEAVRLAVLGILLSIGLTVGFGLPAPWFVRVSAGMLATLAGAAALRIDRSRRLLLAIADWVVRT